jgi:hypothetical protein
MAEAMKEVGTTRFPIPVSDIGFAGTPASIVLIRLFLPPDLPHRTD